MSNNNDKKVLNVPALRFPEFTDEWEETELQNIVPNICAGKDKHSNDGTIVLYGSTGIIGMTTNPSYTEELILVARVGANAGQLQVTNTPCGVTDNTLVINAKSWNLYIYYYLQHYNLNRLVFGSGQPLITGGMLKKIKVMYGIKSERDKITHMLCILDERIKLQNKIIEDLKKLKSAIYQDLFSNLQGDEISLSELAEIVKGQQVNGDELSENGKYYVMNGGIMPSGYYDDYNTKAGTISISEGGNSCGYVQYNTTEFWSGGHCYTLHIKPTAPILTLFLFHYLKWKEADIMMLRIGSGLPNIQKKDLSKVRIIVPTLDKQQQQIALLSSLQMKIESEEMYLINLDKQKQYLLSQMFI